MSLLHPDRLFPVEASQRDLARALYQHVATRPIVSPHGHCDPRWFADNQRFPDPAQLLVVPDHYLLRMLVSQGVSLAELGVAAVDGVQLETDPERIWERFATHYHLFRGTPSSLWLDHVFEFVFGLEEPLSQATAADYYRHIEAQLATESFLPRALFDQFGIEVLATTEGALDSLEAHRAIADSDWQGKVITTYRPDSVVDPAAANFVANIKRLGELTGEDVESWSGYLQAHRQRRAFFREHGATATDHGHPSAHTENLPEREAAALYAKVLSGQATPVEAERFRGQMLTEMALMSLDDGMSLQIHAGSRRNHSAAIAAQYGPDKGFDIPGPTDYVQALRPLLDRVGLEPDLTILLFTLDESVYARELAPLAGVYPALTLGPPWWFFDSPEGMRRYRESVTETCGFYNTAGFNDDTRAFCSIPARHDMARRVDCAFLANLVATGRLRENEAEELAVDLAGGLARKAYGLD